MPLPGKLADYARYEALSNLLTNAVEHGDGGVSSSANVSQNMARVTVTTVPAADGGYARAAVHAVRLRHAGASTAWAWACPSSRNFRAHRGRAYATWVDGRAQFYLDAPLRLSRISTLPAAGEEAGMADTLVRAAVCPGRGVRAYGTPA